MENCNLIIFARTEHDFHESHLFWISSTTPVSTLTQNSLFLSHAWYFLSFPLLSPSAMCLMNFSTCRKSENFCLLVYPMLSREQLLLTLWEKVEEIIIFGSGWRQYKRRFSCWCHCHGCLQKEITYFDDTFQCAIVLCSNFWKILRILRKLIKLIFLRYPANRLCCKMWIYL